MKKSYEAKQVGAEFEPPHTVEVMCANCNHDLPEVALNASTCPNCSAPLNLKQNVSISVAELPPIFGSTIE